MNGIIGMTELTLDSDLNRSQRESLLLVHSLARSLLLIIDDILDISKSLTLLSCFMNYLNNDTLLSRGWPHDNGSRLVFPAADCIWHSQDARRSGLAK